MSALYVVSTPIGNLEDVTLRALRILREADLLLAEDTRRTRILLTHHEVSGRPHSLHAHNEQARTAEVLDALRAGRSVALVSDAGTPLVSDPGARLVAAVLAEGFEVVPIPGASAVLAALTVAGFPAAPFAFLGFLPRRAGARRTRLAAWRDRPEALVVFESPRRLSGTLAALHDVLGERRACVARELTKLHEEAVRGTLTDLAKRFEDGARGEVTIVVEGAARRRDPDAPLSDDEQADLDARIRALLDAGQGPRRIAAALAPDAHIPRRTVYSRVLEIRDAAEPAAGTVDSGGVGAR